MSDAQRHHYIPVFYLKKWRGPDLRLVRYEKRQGRVVIKRCSPKSTGYEIGLYSLDKVPSKRRQELELLLARAIDTPAAEAHRLLLAGVHLNLQLHFAWSLFLMSLRARVPESIAKMRTDGLTAVKAVLAADPEQYLAVRGASPELNLEEWARNNIPGRVENFGISLLPKLLIGNPEMIEKVSALQSWTLDTSGEATKLVTSDRPCVWINGVDAWNFVVAPPLSPSVAFVAAKNVEAVKKLMALSRDEFARLLNISVAAQAVKYIYASGPEHVPLVKQYLRNSDGS